MARQASQWLANRDAIAGSAESRQFVDGSLGELAARRFSPSAWASFIGRRLARDSRWTSLVALATDFADARRAVHRNASAFGAFADPIADGAFWSWFALRWEPNR